MNGYATMGMIMLSLGVSAQHYEHPILSSVSIGVAVWFIIFAAKKEIGK